MLTSALRALVKELKEERFLLGCTKLWEKLNSFYQFFFPYKFLMRSFIETGPSSCGLGATAAPMIS